MAKRIPQAYRAVLHKQLRKLRTDEGLTQNQVASRLGRLQSYVSKYELGEQSLDMLEVREICLALGTTLEQFSRNLEKALK
ncbi:MAG TPA: helix-turn-helix transcriptional regulator [Gammaproteobacteria bacterium]|jgi:transcriptional regulator with XRE-family HTH domain